MIRLDEVISSLDWSRTARLCHRSRPLGTLGTLTAATHLGMQDCVESETKGCHCEHNKAVSSAKEDGCQHYAREDRGPEPQDEHTAPMAVTETHKPMMEEIGRACVGKECWYRCRSRWWAYH